jgi:hypothetical protein
MWSKKISELAQQKGKDIVTVKYKNNPTTSGLSLKKHLEQRSSQPTLLLTLEFILQLVATKFTTKTTFNLGAYLTACCKEVHNQHYF